ncbi:hypothetical protein HanRHA438_Chr10g0463521 [Helianthus annuus]|nr:hypothetical protein HanRHA438_Chr10g0463521 [Helianthus annuus]
MNRTHTKHSDRSKSVLPLIQSSQKHLPEPLQPQRLSHVAPPAFSQSLTYSLSSALHSSRIFF